MAVIQSGADTTLLTVDPTSAAARMTLYSASGAVLASVAGTTATSAVPVQGVTGGVPMPVTGSFSLGAGSQVQLVAGSAAVGSVTLGAPLPAGTNALGSVTLGAGSAAIGSVTLAGGSTVALAAGAAAIGSVTLGAALPAGTNSIGTVVLGAGNAAVGTVALAAGSTVALAAGAAAIGSVTLGAALPTGANTIGNVGITGSLPAGGNSIGTVVLGAGSAAVGSVTVGAALPTGGNTIGNVGLTGSLPTGVNTIGKINQGVATDVTNGWPTIHGELAVDATGTFTNATQTTNVSTLSVAPSTDGYNTILLTISGTFTGASGVFEYTDDSGTTWFPCGAVRGDGSGLPDQSYTLLAAPRTWYINAAGADAVRVRSTAVATGSAIVRMSILSAPLPGAFPHPVSLISGTSNIGNVGITNPTAQAAGIYASLNPYGSLRVTNEPSPIFFDPFDGTVDANKWTTAGTAPVATGGQISINAGTVAAATSRATSVPTFASPGLGFEVLGLTVQVEAAPVANAYRFWGWASEPGVPAYQAPAATISLALTDAIGFELDGAGNLYGVIYASTVLAHRTTAIPAALWKDGGVHRYAIMKRSDVVFWFVEGQDAPVASVSYKAPTIQTLSIKFGSYNNGTTAPTAYTYICGAIAVHDSTSASQQLSDGTYAWRKAAVTARGTQGTYGLATQDLKDSGRTTLVITANTPLGTLSGTAGTETALGVQYSRSGAAMSVGVNTVQVTTGKTLRIQSLSLMARAFAATATAVQVTLRINTGGAVTTTSPILWSGALSVPATVAQVGTVLNIDFPDGLEVPSAANIGFTYNQTTASVIGMSGNVIGFEY